jgi:NADPH-dependent glutamate synthase beta subunit-like oxidoreductase/NAD-dependent dihydropyrimidine dehydrogenase PreA subunit
MLRLGVPEYRLSRELIKLEIQFILSLGVELKLNARLGRDFTLTGLKEQGYEAVFLAIGAHKSRGLKIEGVEFDGVLDAVDFLLNVNLGYKVEFGEKVVVIGGGNVAFDVARTVLRHGEVPDIAVSDLRSAMDVARSAVRFGATEIHMACLEARHEMLANEVEIHEGLEEGIKLHPARGPVRILGEDGKVKGLETIAVRSIFDDTGRFNPSYIPGTESVIEADTVIIAIGQAADLSFLRPEDGIELTPRRTIAVDPQTLATSAPGIYAGGDVAFGPRIAITAVADGLKAAKSIDEFLQGRIHPPHSVRIKVLDADAYQMPKGYDRIPRQPIPVRPIDRRVGIAEVELGYTEEQARKEAKRCLHCWVNTIFEGSEEYGTICILCGGCVDVCPEDCLELIPFDLLQFADSVVGEHAKTEYSFAPTVDQPMRGAVMLKDETICIRCGLCAKRCPTGCITLESFFIEEGGTNEPHT